jgi:uncharacterized protein YbbK (DUF523 family)
VLGLAWAAAMSAFKAGDNLDMFALFPQSCVCGVAFNSVLSRRSLDTAGKGRFGVIMRKNCYERKCLEII